MTKTNSSPIGQRRERNHRQVSARIERQSQKGHAGLVRDVVAPLGNSEPESEVRDTQRQKTVATRARGFKKLLASAPLEGIDLKRSRDTGRDIPL